MRYFLFEGTPPKLYILEDSGLIREATEIFTTSMPQAVELKPVMSLPTRARKEKRLPDLSAKEAGPSGKTAEVSRLMKEGKSDNDIATALGIKIPAVYYHKKKLGLSKERISGRMRKAKDEAPLAADGDENWEPVATKDEVLRIWDCVDDGVRSAGAIAIRLGMKPSAVQKVLMDPRPPML